MVRLDPGVDDRHVDVRAVRGEVVRVDVGERRPRRPDAAHAGRRHLGGELNDRVGYDGIHPRLAADLFRLAAAQVRGIPTRGVLEDVGRLDAVLALSAGDRGIDVGILFEQDDHRHLRVRRQRAGHDCAKDEDRQGDDGTGSTVVGRAWAAVPPSLNDPLRRVGVWPRGYHRHPLRFRAVTPRASLLLDVDTGIDDSLALLYACASPEAELLAVTCCSGNVEAQQVVENTLAVLELAGRDDVEVALGREVPLVRALETTPETHGPRGIGYAELPPPRRPVSERHGADVIVETAQAQAGRGDPRHARPAHEPGHRARSRAEPAAAPSRRGC